ncbi:MAG: uracil-DNA glycosylase [Desulfomonilaceae bacterium]
MNEAEDRLRDLGRKIVRCVRCPLHEGRTHAVPGEGDPSARVMFVGEAPGEQEDKHGKPFCGRSGRFLDQLLALAGLTRQAVFITSAVKCRPPHNRTPHKDELDTCRELWLLKQTAIVDPEIVVLMGRTAIRSFLNKEESLEPLHGTTIGWEARQFLITYHPAAGMRFPKVGQSMKGDFRKLASLAF